MKSHVDIKADRWTSTDHQGQIDVRQKDAECAKVRRQIHVVKEEGDVGIGANDDGDLQVVFSVANVARGIGNCLQNGKKEILATMCIVTKVG